MLTKTLLVKTHEANPSVDATHEAAQNRKQLYHPLCPPCSVVSIVITPYLQVESDEDDDSESDVVPTIRRANKKSRVEQISRQCKLAWSPISLYVLVIVGSPQATQLPNAAHHQDNLLPMNLIPTTTAELAPGH